MNKYERGQIQRVDWLDRLTFKTMEKIKERESLKNGSSHLYLVVDFCSFEHRVVFQVFLVSYLLLLVMTLPKGLISSNACGDTLVKYQNNHYLFFIKMFTCGTPPPLPPPKKTYIYLLVYKWFINELYQIALNPGDSAFVQNIK